MRNTKRLILETALELFSQKGFTAVGIRELCGAVGIKESSVYYHFTNKQEIFESLLHDFKEIIASMQRNFDSKTKVITGFSEESFIAVGRTYLTNCLLDKRILKFIRMLSIEQHVNKEAAKLYQELLFEAPLKKNEKAIEKLIASGCFRDGDIPYMAEEYYAPLFCIFQRYFSSGNVTDEILKQANERLAAHLRCYFRKYVRIWRIKQ